MTSETSTPASSLTDKEREAIEQMPYEEARDTLIQAVNLLRLHLPRQHAGVEHDVIDSGEGRHIINIRRP